MSCLCGIDILHFHLLFLTLLFRLVPFGFGRGCTFCLDYDCRMFLLPWIVYISKDVGREDVGGFDTPWQSLCYKLG